MTWDYANPYTLAVAPQQADIDGLNHTNNAVYVHWCERIGWAHSIALGMDLAAWQALDRAWVIRHAEYDYTLPTLRGEALTLGTWLTQCDGKLTMERRFQLVRDADGQTVLRGRWSLVCVEISSGRARRMPEAFARAYGPAVVSPSPCLSPDTPATARARTAGPG